MFSQSMLRRKSLYFWFLSRQTPGYISYSIDSSGMVYGLLINSVVYPGVTEGRAYDDYRRRIKAKMAGLGMLLLHFHSTTNKYNTYPI
jgi:hypothetical protein